MPWWAHRRRRARVRVERKLEAWPDIAKAVGLAGSQVMSAVVDVWGWRARLRLARGQTIADVTARIPAIESGLGTFRGAVRVYPTPDDLANRCELRVLDMDPHADADPVARPVRDLDHRADRPRPVRGRHAVPRAVPAPARPGRRRDRVGQERLAQRAHGQPRRLPRRGHLGHRPEEGHGTQALGTRASTGSPPPPSKPAPCSPTRSAILQARAELLAATGQRVWEPSPDMPALIIIIDEYAELVDDAPGRQSGTPTRSPACGRAVAVTLIAATQRPTQKAMGQGAVRSQMDMRICFRVRERKDVDLVLGQGMLSRRLERPRAQRARQVPRSPLPEHDTPQPRPRLPRHRPGRRRHRTPVRRLPARAGRGVAPRP